MYFWQLIGLQDNHGIEIFGTHSNPYLVVFSIIIASFAAYSSLSVVERMQSYKGNNTLLCITWHVVGAFGMGWGIWAMHFSAMLAFTLPVTVNYNLIQTLFSVIPAILCSGVALYIMAKKSINFLQLQTGAFIMASGIGLMHYTGMDAMEMNASMRYDTTFFILSIVVAHLLSTIALAIRFKVQEYITTKSKLLFEVLGAVAMGISISGMHYTAMTAAHYYTIPYSFSNVISLPPPLLGIFIGGFVGLSLALTLIGTIVDRHLYQAGKSLSESEEIRKSILSSMAEGLIATDNSGLVNSINPAGENILGMPSNKILGCEIVKIFNSREVSLVLQLIFKQTFTIKRIDRILLKRQDGTIWQAEITITPLVNNNHAVGYTFIFRDITSRIKKENELKKMNEDLFVMSRNAGQAEIASGVLHNVGNILNSLNISNSMSKDIANSFNLERLSDTAKIIKDANNTAEIDNNTITKAAEYIDCIAKISLQHQQNIIDELAVASKYIEHINNIISRQQQYVSHSESLTGIYEKVHVRDLLNEAVSLSLSDAGHINIKKEYKHVNELNIDKHSFIQILVNLIKNAADSIHISETREGMIILRTHQIDSKTIRIQVEDNGVGIPAERAKDIFNFGFTTKDSGNGFGLHLSANIAAANNAKISFHSDGPGKGSTFSLDIQSG